MSDDALRAELARYLRQQVELGRTWMLAQPSGELAVAPSVTVEVAQVIENKEIESAVPAQVTSVAVAPVPLARDAAFAQECERFVADSLAVIARTRQAPAPAATRDRQAKAAALAALAAEVAPCQACKLHGGRTQTVFGSGNPDADLVLVGEAPGREEDLQGLPFVGESGQLLTRILEAIDLPRDEVFICNILKCRPPQNRDPQPDEVLACEPFLSRQLAILQPRIVLCLGRIAAQTLLGTGASLTNLRRTVHFYRAIPLLATYHPAALLRNAAYKRDTWNDVRKVRALLDALRAG